MADNLSLSKFYRHIENPAKRQEKKALVLSRSGLVMIADLDSISSSEHFGIIRPVFLAFFGHYRSKINQ
jgi:hypothetical protein